MFPKFVSQISIIWNAFICPSIITSLYNAKGSNIGFYSKYALAVTTSNKELLRYIYGQYSEDMEKFFIAIRFL